MHSHRPAPSAVRRPLAGLLTGSAAVALLAGCAAGHAASAVGATTGASTGAHHVQGRVGTLLIEDGYVPEPASPDVAAAYLTIVNNGGTPVRLTGVTSAVASSVMPMTEISNGALGSMTPLHSVVVPAHGSFRFHPGAAHLMLEQPQPVPNTGGAVALTVTFAPGGTVNVSLPVTAIGATPSMPSVSMPNG